MQNQTGNPCIRCGKQRITAKTWQEQVGQSLITHIVTVCPDEECQKIVDRELNERREKKELLTNKRLQAKKTTGSSEQVKTGRNFHIFQRKR